MPGRVHSLRQFERLAAPAARGRSGPLRINFAPPLGPEEGVAVAFAIGKRVGGAVERNRLRRRLRAAMDQERTTILPGLYLIKCDLSAKELSYEQLRNHLHQALTGARVAR